jgi:5,10-methylene-tetrahydrofolate dehydrogenase/methenyl tetrahydrofolate cyclohydrolase
VDGLHPLNVSRLANTQTHVAGATAWNYMNVDYNIPCTPQGCVELLERSGVVIEGKEAVVIGRSNMVGVPVAHLLMHMNATVTIAHSRTKNIAEVVKRADIVIAAVGRAELVKGDWLKPGAVVIDVGINSVDDASKKVGYRLVGDVDFAAAQPVTSLITPVPGGVGPMTIAMLLRNTVHTAKRMNGIPHGPIQEAEAATK